jgi:hypothetical protein
MSHNKSQNRPKLDLPVEDWARLAAYIDGEGWIGIKEQKRGGRAATYHVEITVCNQDPRLILWIAQRFGGHLSNQGPPKNNLKRRHRIFQWYASCSVAHEVLLGCLPYFVIKRNQAEIAIAFRNLTGARKWGVKGMPLELKQQQIAFRKELQDAKTLHYEQYEEAVN